MANDSTVSVLFFINVNLLAERLFFTFFLKVPSRFRNFLEIRNLSSVSLLLVFFFILPQSMYDPSGVDNYQENKKTTEVARTCQDPAEQVIIMVIIFISIHVESLKCDCINISWNDIMLNLFWGCRRLHYSQWWL